MPMLTAAPTWCSEAISTGAPCASTMPMLTVAPTWQPSTSTAASAKELRRRSASTIARSPPEPADEIDRPHLVARRLAEDLQHAVADRVSEAVVDRFEIVEVHQQDRGRL